MKQQMHNNNTLYHQVLLDAGYNTRKCYLTHLLGNTLKSILLDHNLLKDLNDRVERHILLAFNLNTDNPRKFSLTIPKYIVLAIERVQKDILTSQRIAQDIN